MNRILAICKKEIFTYFSSLSTIVTLLAVLALVNWIYWGEISATLALSQRGFFTFLPLVLIIIVPALTMRLFSEEKRNGTLEIIFTLPVHKMEVILGKLLSVMTLIGVFLVMTTSITITLSSFGNLDLGVILGGYLGVILISLLFSSLTMLFSSQTKNQISVLLISSVILFISYLFGTEYVTASNSPFLGLLSSYISFLPAYESLTMGVITLRAVVTLLIPSIILLILTYISIVKTEDKIIPKTEKDVNTTLLLTTLIFLSLIYLSSIYNPRLDISRNKSNSLTKSSVEYIQQIKNPVKINAFLSGSMPSEFQSLRLSIVDFLNNLVASSNGNIQVNFYNPDTDESIKAEAKRLGVPEIDFQSLSKEDFTLKKGFFGLSLSYLDKTAIIASLQNSQTLEYEIMSKIKSISNENKLSIQVLESNDTQNPINPQIINYLVGENFKLAPESEDLQTSDIILVINSGQNISDEKLYQLDQAIMKGKKVFIASESFNAPMQFPVMATDKNSNLDELLKNYGVEIEKNVILDESNIKINAGRTPNEILPINYPPFISILDEGINNEIPGFDEISQVILPFASSLKFDSNDNGIKKWVSSSPKSWALALPANLTPDQLQQFSGEKSAKTIGVQISGKRNSLYNSKTVPSSVDQNTTIKESEKVSILVLGDSDILTEQSLQNPNNAFFLLSIIANISGDDLLSSIQAKAATSEFFPATVSQSTIQILKYVNILLPISFYAIIIYFVFHKRKKF